MHTKDLLGFYDRVLSIDSDIIINKDCKNPFTVIPEDMIGSVYEDVGSRQKARRKVIRDIQDRFGNIG